MTSINSSYSLVIQGPIISTGFTGSTYILRDTDQSGLVKTMDCKANIQQLLQEFASLFRAIVVVTWEGEPIEPADLDGYQPCQLLKLTPLDQVYINEAYPTGEINMHKQYHSTRAGILALSQHDQHEHYVVKIRADQWVNLAQLIQEHQQASEAERQQKIFLSSYGGLKIGDFYFAARQDVFLNFCDAIVELLPEYPQMDIERNSVHLVAPLLYSIRLAGQRAGVANIIYLKSLAPIVEQYHQTYENAGILKEYATFIEKNFTCFSKDLMLQMVWRGDYFELVPDSYIYFHIDTVARNISDIPIDVFNIFLYYSPKRYFAKKGAINLTSILGAINWIGMQLFPFYRNWIINRTKNYE